MRKKTCLDSPRRMRRKPRRLPIKAVLEEAQGGVSTRVRYGYHPDSKNHPHHNERSNAVGRVEIRQLEARDAEEFSALRRAVTADNPVPMGLTMDEELTRPLQGFRDQLSSPAPNAAYGAFVDGVLQGCAALAWTSRFASSRHKAELWGTFVAPKHRGQGIARMLVGRAIEHGRNNALQRINLMVYIPNAPAVALYESLGFTPYGVEPKAVCLNGQFYDCQHMTFALD